MQQSKVYSLTKLEDRLYLYRSPSQ